MDLGSIACPTSVRSCSVWLSRLGPLGMPAQSVGSRLMLMELMQ